MSGFGDALRHARANKGVTLTEAERALRIPRKYLRALEDEDFPLLPEGVYSRGIVRNYAQYLHLDPDDAIAYFEELRGQASGSIKVVPAVKPLEMPSHWAPNFALIAFVFVISAVLFAWLYSAFFATREYLPTPTPGLPTPTVLDVSQAILALTPTNTIPPVPTATLPPPPPPTATPVPPTATAKPPVVQAPAPPQPTAVVAAPPAQAPPAPKPSKAPEHHVVTVKALEAAWVTVTVDGEIEYNGEMPPGKMLNFEGGSINIQSGNSTAVYLWVDGGDYGLLSDTDSVAEVNVP